MRSTSLALILDSTAIDSIPEVRATLAVAAPAPLAPAATSERRPSLRVMPLLSETKTRQFVRVPTHAVGVHPEHREYPRATLRLPLRLRSVNEVQERFPITLVTRDISSSGVFFLCPKHLAAGTKIEIEIILVSRPMGRGNVVVATAARVKRLEPAATPGWYGVAALFEDVAFDRDDRVPTRFMS
ncbi:MAG: PilZ domain-containing protein [Acidobacteria bacterium]|nr:PilZ domain-containing protein [Acidobacteriota bacterium]